MTFDQVLNQKNSLYFVHIEYGGQPYMPGSMTLYQQKVFYNDVVNYLVKNKEDEFLDAHNIEELYDLHAQHTSLRWPMYIVVVKDREVVYSSYIVDLDICIDNIKNRVNGEKVFFYNHAAMSEFNKVAITHYVNTGNKVQHRFRSLESLVDSTWLYDNLEKHIAVLDLNKFDTSTQKVSDHYYISNPMYSMKLDYDSFVANINKKAIILDILANKLLCI